MLQLVPKSVAKERGHKRYFTGIPCGCGHVVERQVSDGDCVECRRLRRAEFSKVHADRINARSRDWYAANKEKAKQTRADWRQRNAEKDRADVYAYAEANRDRMRPYQNHKGAIRRSMKLRATPAWADQKAIRRIYEAASALTKTTGVAHHVDHIVPLVSDLVCGLHCEANLQVLTARENSSKSNRSWPDMPA